MFAFQQGTKAVAAYPRQAARKTPGCLGASTPLAFASEAPEAVPLALLVWLQAFGSQLPPGTGPGALQLKPRQQQVLPPQPPCSCLQEQDGCATNHSCGATPCKEREKAALLPCRETGVSLTSPLCLPVEGAPCRCSISGRVALSTGLSCSWAQGWRVKLEISWLAVSPCETICTLTLFSDVNKGLFCSEQSRLLLSAACREHTLQLQGCEPGTQSPQLGRARCWAALPRVTGRREAK